jgi:hypothetical protein
VATRQEAQELRIRNAELQAQLDALADEAQKKGFFRLCSGQEFALDDHT